MQSNSGQRSRGGRPSDRPRGSGGGRGSGNRNGGGNRDEGTTGRSEGHAGRGMGRGYRRDGGYQRGGGSDPRRSPPPQRHGPPGEGRGPPRMLPPPVVDTGGDNAPTGNECVVCCREISVYAVGSCDHTVCYVCSTRLRVLCKTQECPVCRATVEEVFFIKENTPFGKLQKNLFNLREEEFAICFEDDEIRLKYDELLQHKCKECERRALIATRSGERPPALQLFATFDDLTDHVLTEHRRHFCALCVEHLNLFTYERQAYSKNDLRRHMDEGDLDDKSHKGHPRCHFCQEHFLDKDELYRHLKVEHFTCFICNASSRVLEYYATYDELRQHFKSKHYLCEQGECATTRFVAFATELEHKAHCAASHSDHLSREEQRAARSVNLDFGTLPHDRELIGADGRRGGREGGRRDYRDDRRRRDASPNGDPVSLPGRTTTDEWGREIPVVDMSSTTDFPTLGGAPSNTSRPLVPTPQYGRKMTMVKTAEEFPSLGPPTEADPPLAMPFRRATPNFQKVAASASGSSSLSSVLAGLPSNHQSSRSVHSNPAITVQKISGPTVVSAPRRSERPAPQTASDVFPSLPEPVPDSTFGKVLKPLPPKKPNNAWAARQAKSENGSNGSSSGWAAVAAGGITINKKSNSGNSNSNSNKKNKKKGTDSAGAGTKQEVNGNANKMTVQQRLVDLRTILPSLSEIENNNDRSGRNNNRPTNTDEHLQGLESKGGENLDDFDLNVCGASWGSAATKKSEPEVERKTAKLPTQPRGLRKEEFPSLGPAQAKEETISGIRQLKPKYKGLKPGDAVAEMKRQEGAFIQPPLYNKRHTELMGMLKLLLDGSTEQVFEYRTLLGNLRNDLITAEEFVQHCLQLFPDPTEFTKIFPDLICLLPDIGKQNELAPIYDELRIRFGGSSGAGRANKSGGSRGEKSSEPWVRCTECGQITAPEDFQPHLRAH